MVASVHYIGHAARVQTTSEFNDWFGSLRDKQVRQRISVRITRLAQGNPGQHRYILLCGGDKDSQARDIERARVLASRL